MSLSMPNTSPAHQFKLVALATRLLSDRDSHTALPVLCGLHQQGQAGSQAASVLSQ